LLTIMYMQFVSNRPSTNNNNNNNNNKVVQYRQPRQNLSTITRSVTPMSQQMTTTSPTPKKMAWGEPTWYVLHTMAEKVKDEVFPSFRQDLLNTIFMICTNLPCPTCSNHATQYLSKINMSSIQTKEDLKRLLFNFHNTVNEQKGYPQFAYSDLDPKYSAANLVNMIQHFMLFFQEKNKNVKMIANDMYRARIIAKLKEWFNVNISQFSI
jgi:Erv1 / Alr family